jgi:anti-sigma regulatory factor (Ser/Thr protein kinase)
VSGSPELRLRCLAHSGSVRPIRHALRAFLEALGFDSRSLDDVTTAAGEALANVVEHAYGRNAKCRPDVELLARLHRGSLAIDICDRGSFVKRKPLPGRGFGLRIIRAIARQTRIETANGTRVRMRFPGPAQKS